MTRDPVVLEPITPALLDEVRDAIVACLAPDKIILFGSAVRADSPSPHDIDLYVIKEGIQDVRAAARKIEELFSGRLFALDVVVRTPEQIRAGLKAGNSFLIHEVLGKGRVLYL